MPGKLKDSLENIASSINAHSAHLGDIVQSVGDKLVHEIQGLQHMEAHIVQPPDDTTIIAAYQLRLENLVLAFRPCRGICVGATSDGRALKDEEFRALVMHWDVCKQQAYSSVVYESERLLMTNRSFEQPFRKLQDDQARIDSEILNSGRLAIVNSARSFNEDLHVLLSIVRLKAQSGSVDI
jgi:hypothetical protein